MNINNKFPAHHCTDAEFVNILNDLARFKKEDPDHGRLIIEKMNNKEYVVKTKKLPGFFWRLLEIFYLRIKPRSERIKDINEFTVSFFSENQDNVKNHLAETMMVIQKLSPVLKLPIASKLMKLALDTEEVLEENQNQTLTSPMTNRPKQKVVKEEDILGYKTSAQTSDTLFLSENEVLMPLYLTEDNRKTAHTSPKILIKTKTIIKDESGDDKELFVNFMVDQKTVNSASQYFKTASEKELLMHSSIESLSDDVKENFPTIQYFIDLSNEDWNAPFIERALLCLVNGEKIKEVKNLQDLLDLYSFADWALSDELQKRCLNQIRDGKLMTMEGALELLQSSKFLKADFLNYLYDFIAGNKNRMTRGETNIYRQLGLDHQTEINKRKFIEYAPSHPEVTLDVSQTVPKENTWTWNISNSVANQVLAWKLNIQMPIEIKNKKAFVQLEHGFTYGSLDHISCYIDCPFNKNFTCSFIVSNKNTGEVITTLTEKIVGSVHYYKNSGGYYLGNIYPSQIQNLNGADLEVKLMIHSM